MIYVIVILFSLFAPFLGVVGMEMRAYSLTASQYGYRVGATEAYLMYIVIIVLTIYTVKLSKIFERSVDKPPVEVEKALRGTGNVRIELAVLTILSIFLAYHNLVLAGGWRVVEGIQGRGDFRTGLGSYGAAAYLIIKWYAPLILAYSSVLCLVHKDRMVCFLTLFIFVFSCLSSISFGYKASVILLVTPSLMMVFWKPRLLTLVLFPAFGLALIVGGYLLFGVDKVGSTAHAFSKSGLFDQLFYRVFVLQGELPWKIWGEYVQGHELPNYLGTLKSLLGGRLGNIFFSGSMPVTPEEIVAANFGMLTTYFAGYPIEGVLAGHNSTATAFSEGVLAGGMAGVVAYSVLAGLVIYFVYQVMDVSLKQGNCIIACVFSVYSIFGVMSWLIGGGLSTLIHISVVFGFVTSVLMLLIVRYVSTKISERLQKAI